MASLVDMLNMAPELGVVVGIVVSIRVLGWLVGLVIVLRGCPPEHRPKILRAYGASQPSLARHRHRSPGRTDWNLSRDEDSADL